MKQIIIFCLLLTSVAVRGQYNPSTATVTNKPLGIAQAVPTDARSYYYDASLFIWRPYQSTAEVLSYLNLTKYRTGQFPIFVNEGGTLQSNGSFVGGVIKEYVFKNGTANSNLVVKTYSAKGTISQLRASVGEYDNYISNEKGKEGTWVLDTSDHTSLDDGIRVLVTTDGKRLKSTNKGIVLASEFGAVPDGVTDNTAAIQKAINSGYHTILFGYGTYIIKGTDTLKNGVVLKGMENGLGSANGSASVIIRHRPDTAGVDMFVNDYHVGQYTNSGGLENFYLNTSDSGKTSTIMNFRNISGYEIRNITILGPATTAFMSLGGMIYCKFTGIKMGSGSAINTPVGILFTSYNGDQISTTNKFEDIYISGTFNYSTGGVNDCVKALGSSSIHTIFQKCNFESVNGSAFNIEKGNIFTIIDQYTENIPNKDTSVALFIMGVVGQPAPNNAYNTNGGLKIKGGYFQMYRLNSGTRFIQADQVNNISLSDMDITHSDTLVVGTTSTITVSYMNVRNPAIKVDFKGIVPYRLNDLGGNLLGQTAVTENSKWGTDANRLLYTGAGKLNNGDQYYAYDFGIDGEHWIYNKVTKTWKMVGVPKYTSVLSASRYSKGQFISNANAYPNSFAGWIVDSSGQWRKFGLVSGGTTLGRVMFGSSDGSSQSDYLQYDSVNHFLSVGTGLPASFPLDIQTSSHSYINLTTTGTSHVVGLQFKAGTNALKWFIRDVGGFSSPNDKFQISFGPTEIMSFKTNGNIGINVADPQARLHLIYNGEQFRNGYDASNYMSMTTQSTGKTIFSITGTFPYFSFSNPILVGSGVIDANAALELQSTTKGFLPPRMNRVQFNAITPTVGNIAYDKDNNKVVVSNGATTLVLTDSVTASLKYRQISDTAASSTSTATRGRIQNGLDSLGSILSGRILTGSAILDFPSTTFGSSSDLTVSVVGATLSDPVSLGIPNGSITTTAKYTAWVSAANTVTVRFIPNATEDPPSGTFKVAIFH